MEENMARNGAHAQEISQGIASKLGGLVPDSDDPGKLFWTKLLQSWSNRPSTTSAIPEDVDTDLVIILVTHGAGVQTP